MLLDLTSLVRKYNLNLDGVIHCGAHIGSEKYIYDSLGIAEKNQHYIEPQNHIFEILKTNVGTNVNLYNCAVGRERSKSIINIEFANNSQSSSLADFELHSHYYPHIKYESTQDVEVYPLDELVSISSGEWLLNADLQSWELEMLKGAKLLLPNIRCIMLEVNDRPLYRGCPHISELDRFLLDFNFRRVETYFVPGFGWGDGFWIRFNGS